MLRVKPSKKDGVQLVCSRTARSSAISRNEIANTSDATESGLNETHRTCHYTMWPPYPNVPLLSQQQSSRQ
ncbi:MAG: hypothetical protein WBL67_20470 [Nitrososphaeraceae archaeon]